MTKNKKLTIIVAATSSDFEVPEIAPPEPNLKIGKIQNTMSVLIKTKKI